MIRYISLLIFIGLAWGQQHIGWSYTFPIDDGYAIPQDMQITSDGGYIVTGCSSIECTGESDLVMMKFDIKGNLLWTQIYDFVEGNIGGYSIIEKSQGNGYAITGTKSGDILLISTDGDGEIGWEKTYHFYGNDIGRSLIQTSDYGYVIVGKNGADAQIIKTNLLGDIVWETSYGNSVSNDIAYSIIENSNNEFIITGSVYVTGSNTEVFLIKISADGELIWEKTYGASGYDMAFDVIETNDSGYAIIAMKNSGEESWLIKTDIDGDTLWTKTYGGNGESYGYSLIQTQDNGYAITGDGYPINEDLYIIKMDEIGQTLWSVTLDGYDDARDAGRVIKEATNGDLVVLGNYGGEGGGITLNFG